MACITLLSDFGLQDASVAIAKGILMQHNAGIPIVDISHEIVPFQTAEAIYLLSAAWRRFPAGTCHVLLFDLFSEKTTRVLIAERDNHYFLTADNGVLPLATGLPMAGMYRELLARETYTHWLHATGEAIQGILQNNTNLPETTGYKLKTTVGVYPELENNEVSCDVIHTDHYENVVVNVTRDQFEVWRAGRAFRLQFVQVEEIRELSNSYADVRPGMKLCRFNSQGYLEICVNRGNAASLFGMKVGGKKNAIKIIFE